MKDITTTPTTKSETRSGVVPSVVHLALDVADRGQSTAIALLHDTRTELRVVADHAIELADKLTASGLRLARKVTQRIDEASAETLTNVERVLGTAVRRAKETTHAATELANSAINSVAASA